MDIFTTFATNQDKEVNGSWVPLSLATGAELLIARAGNRLHAKMMTALYKEHRLSLENTDPDVASKTDELLNIKAIAATILKGWKKLKYKGEELAYSVENAEMLLAHGDFRALVMSHARSMDLFRAELETAAKND